jgi:hypothetical protein
MNVKVPADPADGLTIASAVVSNGLSATCNPSMIVETLLPAGTKRLPSLGLI